MPADPGYNACQRTKSYVAYNPWEHFANSVIDEKGRRVSGWHVRNAGYGARADAAHSETAFLTDRAINFLNQVDAQQGWHLHLRCLKPHWPHLASAPSQHAVQQRARTNVVQLRSADDERWKTAIEEFIRWASPTMHVRRTAREDIELHDKTIYTGDKVVL